MTFEIKALVFIVISLGIARLTGSSFLDSRSYRLYRFFAFEAILALILLNIDFWFDDLISWRQLVSTLFLVISTYLVIHGFLLLRSEGQPDSRRGDSSLIGIEKTTVLVTDSLYRYIRHPLYS